MIKRFCNHENVEAPKTMGLYIISSSQINAVGIACAVQKQGS